MAAREPVAAVVSISAPMLPNHDWRMRFTRYLSAVLPFFPKQDPGANPETERIYTGYPVWPVGALTELQEYLRIVDAALPEIRVPALIMHGSGDDVAPVENLNHIFDRVGSPEKEKVLIEIDEHVITDGRRKADVFAAVGRFLAANMDSGASAADYAANSDAST
jgi:carboxylesterase